MSIEPRFHLCQLVRLREDVPEIAEWAPTWHGRQLEIVAIELDPNREGVRYAVEHHGTLCWDAPFAEGWLEAVNE